MKKLILNLLFLLPFLVSAQLTTYNPDTVCYQTSGSIYEVPSLGADYTYLWSVASPGILINGQGTDSINVDWSGAQPGLISNAISVVATSSTSGCQSQVVNLDVFVLYKLVTITPINTLCAQSPCVNLNGSPANGVWTGTGVTGNQFCPSNVTSGTYTITYSVTQNGCTFSQSTSVGVNPTPVLLPINHN